jgi:chaperonin GroEL
MNITKSRITEIVTGELAKKAILEGTDLLYEPVASTLGAAGRTIIIENVHGVPAPTKDGVTVAKNIVPLDSVERMASETIKQAALNTADEAGDGTTTATIIARGVVTRGLSIMEDKSMNYTDFNKGMNIAVKHICDDLNKQSKKIALKNVASVATISANNDATLGDIIAEAFTKAGDHGVVIMEKSITNNTYVSVTEGFELEKGFTSDVFINVKESNRVEYHDALVLISNVKIEKVSQIDAQIRLAISTETPLVIVADVDEDIIAMLAMNVERKKIKCVIIEPSHFGVRRKDILKDLAITTGALLVDDETGDNFDSLAAVEMKPNKRAVLDESPVIHNHGCGITDKITVERNKTIFMTEPTDELTEHVGDLVAQLDNEKNPTEKSFLEERIAKISSAVAIVKVGGGSVQEQSEKADRVDDSIHATRAALEEGIVAGGGVAYKNVERLFTNENAVVQAGINCVYETILDPLKRVLFNGDIEYRASDFDIKNKGINVMTKEVGDMFDMKIIDPVKVTKTALRNGVSAASTLLSTTSIIVNLRKM